WVRLRAPGGPEPALLLLPLPLGHAECLLAPADGPAADPWRPGAVVEGAGRAAEHPDHLADLPAVEEHLGGGVAVAVLAADRQPAVPVADGGRADRDGFLA